MSDTSDLSGSARDGLFAAQVRGYRRRQVDDFARSRGYASYPERQLSNTARKAERFDAGR